MSVEAKKALAKFPDIVLNATDARGYPFSVRQPGGTYADDGTMPLAIPASFEPVAGPASLLGHFHDDNLWSMKMAMVKGRIEARDGGWVFVTVGYEPPNDFKRMLGAKKRAQAYLEKRGLAWPQVNWGSIDRMWVDAEKLRKR